MAPGARPGRARRNSTRASSVRRRRRPRTMAQTSDDRQRRPAGDALDRGRFVERLRAQGTRYHHLHPFHVRMDAGELTRDELQRWVANRFYYQRVHPAQGRGDPLQLPRGRGAPRVDPADHRPRRHGRRARAGSSRGCGSARRSASPRDELESERHVLPAVRYAVDAYVNFARQRPWIEAVASSLTELFGPSAIRVRLAALEAPLPVDRPGRPPVLPRPARAGAARRRVRARARRRALP